MKDFVLGLCMGIILALLIIWLFERDNDDDPEPEKARQGTPKYAENTIPLGEVG